MATTRGLLLTASLAACLAAGACNDDGGQAPGGGTQEGGTSATTLDANDPSDGSIVCPGNSACPSPDYYGVLVPNELTALKETRGPPQVVCIAGRQNNPAGCPTGFSGRLWNPTGTDQIACAPNQAGCIPNAGNWTYDGYAFLCPKKSSPSECPGIPKK